MTRTQRIIGTVYASALAMDGELGRMYVPAVFAWGRLAWLGADSLCSEQARAMALAEWQARRILDRTAAPRD